MQKRTEFDAVIKEMSGDSLHLPANGKMPAPTESEELEFNDEVVPYEDEVETPPSVPEADAVDAMVN